MTNIPSQRTPAEFLAEALNARHKHTTTQTIAITCPDWCEVPAAEHAAELWDNGGECFHLGAETPVLDPTGCHGSLEEPAFHKPVRVWLSTSTSPQNRETRPPVVNVEGDCLSVDQALALADEIQRQVEMYREAGGVG